MPGGRPVVATPGSGGAQPGSRRPAGRQWLAAVRAGRPRDARGGTPTGTRRPNLPGPAPPLTRTDPFPAPSGIVGVIGTAITSLDRPKGPTTHWRAGASWA